MNLIRVVQNMYELLTATKINQISKNIWSTVAIVLWSLFRVDTGFESVFIGQACKPSADGSSPSVSLLAGLGLFFDEDEADLWRGQLKPIFLAQPQPVGLETNNDANARIDSIFIRPAETDEDKTDRWFFDPLEKNEYEQKQPGRSRYDFETTAVKGVPGSAPEPPDTPAGWLRVCDVNRPSGQANVIGADITDRRSIATISPGDAKVSGTLSLIKEAAQIFGDTSSDYTTLKWEDDGELRLTRRAKASGVFYPANSILHLDDLLTKRLVSESTNGPVEVVDNNFDPGGLKLKFLKPQSGSTVKIQDSSGVDGAGEIEAANVVAARCTVQVDSGSPGQGVFESMNIESVTRDGPGLYEIEFVNPPPGLNEGVFLANLRSAVPGGAAYIIAGPTIVNNTNGASVNILDANNQGIDVDFNFSAMWDFQ